MTPLTGPYRRNLWGTYTNPENELLVAVACLQMDDEAAVRIKSLLGQGVDWPRALAAAGRHRLKPLLYWHLHARFAELVPRDVLCGLREHFMRNSARNLSLSAELVRILAGLEDAGVPALPFKGPVLAHSLYGNLGLREFDDLDILVQEEKLERAAALLHSLGYRATQEIPKGREALFRKMQYEVPYRHERNATCAELHWKFAPLSSPCALTGERVWDRLEWITFAGSRMRNLRAEDTILMLCAHGSRHFWEKLEWICGIAAAIRAYPHMDWTWVLGQARASRSERVLFFGLALAHQLLGAPLPVELSTAVSRDRAVGRLAAEARSRLFVGEPHPFTAVEHSLRQARLSDRWPDRVRAMARMLLLPKYHDWASVDIPAPFSFLYYPVRISRLVWKSLIVPCLRHS